MAKMKFKKTASILSAVVLFITAFSGCGTKNVNSDYNDKDVKKLSSQTVAETDRLRLDFHYEVLNPDIMNKRQEINEISVTDKVTGKVWSNLIKDEYGKYKSASGLDISVQSMDTYQAGGADGGTFYELMRDKNGDVIFDEDYNQKFTEVLRIGSEKIENGVKLTYYFMNYKISVPVSYYLEDDSLKISVEASEIKEGDPNYRLVYVNPSPNMFRVSDQSEDGFILLPVGNGAIMETKDTVELEKEYHEGPSNYVALDTGDDINLPQTARMPVFGLKDGNDAMFCIAEESSGAMGFTATTGSRNSDYAKVTPNVYLVDYDYTLGRSKDSGYIRQLSERTNNRITIGCYFLENENASCRGMADCYRKYLEKNGFIQKTEFADSPYAVDILGGVMATKSVLGVPEKRLMTLTTVNRAKYIVEDLQKLTSYNPTVCLSGYGKTGINYGEIAGGLTVSSKLGNKKDIEAIEKYASSKKIPLFFDFEMSKFSESGKGFGYSADSAKTAILHSADKYFKNVPLGIADPNSEYRILARGKQGEVVKKVLDATDKFGISGINLSSLGSIAYADYNKSKVYSLAVKTESENKDYIAQIRKSKKSVSGKASAYFAAGLLDAVFDLNVDGDIHFSMKNEVPFYQMVFSDITPLYSNSVNVAANPEKVLANAAASGMGISFTLIDEFDVSYMETNAGKLYACSYDAGKDRLKHYVDMFADVYNATKGSRIVDYVVDDNNVSVTTFENGKVVYANHSSVCVDTAIGKLNGYEFKLRGAEQ